MRIPIGTRRRLPATATESDAGMRSDSTGTPGPAAAATPSPRTWSDPRSTAASRMPAEEPGRRTLDEGGQHGHDHRHRGQVTRCACGAHRPDGTRLARMAGAGVTATARDELSRSDDRHSARRSALDLVFRTCAGSTQARRAWLMPHSRCSNSSTRCASESTDRRQPSEIAWRARSTARSRRWRRAVHLEHGPGAGGLRVDGLPVEVEVVAAADHPAGRVGDDVHVRVPDRPEDPGRELGSGLAPADVQGGDDQVEPGEELVVVVEPAVGADLELAAVEQPESLRGGLRRCRAGRLLGRVAAVQRRDDARLAGHALGRQAAGDGEGLGVIGEDLVGVTPASRGLGHHLDRLGCRRTSRSGSGGHRGGRRA